jgi:hypothetical protein
MKKALFVLLLSPLLSTAQGSLPRFENDTLYTSSGYNIYKGQTLFLGKGTSDAGYFKFVKFHYSTYRSTTYLLQNSTVLVKKLKNFKNSAAGESSIEIMGTVTYPDGKKEDTYLVMNFERATEDFAGLPAELIVPAEYRNKRVVQVNSQAKTQNIVAEVKKENAPQELRKLLVADEIRKLFTLYKDGALSKEEYESQKKKLLDRQ